MWNQITDTKLRCGSAVQTTGYTIEVDLALGHRDLYDHAGKKIGYVNIYPNHRPPMPIPDDYDPATQRRGCCDPPDPGVRR